MKKLLLCIITILMFSVQPTFAQNFAWGVKGGLTTGFQKWNRGDRDPLFAYHGIAFIESAPEGNQFAVFAQAGYHVKGSAVRYRNRSFTDPATGNNIDIAPSTDRYEYKNISLTVGGKQKYDFGGGNTQVYYLIGIRGDYTVGTNLAEYDRFRSAFLPRDAFVRKWNYGATLGGGFEIPISGYMSGLIELTVNPDFSEQYVQPPLTGVRDPITGNNISLSELAISNNTVELSIGIRFLNYVEYVDMDSDPYFF